MTNTKNMAEWHKNEWEKNVQETERKIQALLAQLANCQCQDCVASRK